MSCTIRYETGPKTLQQAAAKSRTLLAGERPDWQSGWSMNGADAGFPDRLSGKMAEMQH